MEQDIESGIVDAVIVKDMSRLGRDYLKVGYYTEHFFPEHGVRLLAVMDGVDTNEGDNEFVPFRNIMNEWYARDASKKVRASYRSRGMSGEPIGHPPYGYCYSPETTKRWVIDPDAAEVVRRVFSLSLDGYGIEQIANILADDEVLTPTNYWQSKGRGCGGHRAVRSRYSWSSSTVRHMLDRQEYCGDVINFKTYSTSYKNKRRRFSADKDRVVFEGIHEPIIDRKTFKQVQERRKTVRKRPSKSNTSILSGLVKCATCDSNLHFHFQQANHDITFFSCAHYNAGRRICNATHYVRADFLEQIVLKEVRRLVKYAQVDEEAFAALLMESATQESAAESALRKSRLSDLMKRDDELDRLIKKIYEDNALGRISNERMAKFMDDYEAEQAELTAKIDRLEAEIRNSEGKSASVGQFVDMVRQHTVVKRLTASIANRFIDRIVIHHAERVAGGYKQRIDIYYNCVGKIELPEIEEAPLPEVSLNTRKGVVLNYSPGTAVSLEAS
jgi:hypothetical protein